MQDNNYQYNQTEPKQSGAYDCSNGTNSQYYQNAQYNAYYQNGQYQSQYQNNQYYQPQYQQYQNSQYGYPTPAQHEAAIQNESKSEIIFFNALPPFSLHATVQRSSKREVQEL